MTIEERAKQLMDTLPCDEPKGLVYEAYKAGATDQKAIDHSEEHLNWIIKQHYLWSYEMCQCDNNECCTFKGWIDKAIGE